MTRLILAASHKHNCRVGAYESCGVSMSEVSSDIAVTNTGEVYALENHISGGAWKGDCDDVMEGGFDVVVTPEIHRAVWDELSMVLSPSTDPTFNTKVNSWISEGVEQGIAKRCDNNVHYKNAIAGKFNCIDKHVNTVLIRMALEVRQACRYGLSGALPDNWEKYQQHTADEIHNEVYRLFHTLKLSEKVKQTEIEPCVVPLDTTLKNDFDAY